MYRVGILGKLSTTPSMRFVDTKIMESKRVSYRLQKPWKQFLFFSTNLEILTFLTGGGSLYVGFYSFNGFGTLIFPTLISVQKQRVANTI